MPSSIFERVVTTTNDTVTTVFQRTLPSTGAFLVNARVVGVRTDAAGRVAYWKAALVSRDAGGGAAQVSTTASVIADLEDPAGITAADVTIDVTSNDVRVRVTGIAAFTIKWHAKVEVLEVA